MNTRILGIFCIAASVIAIVGSLGFQVNFENPNENPNIAIAWATGLPWDISVVAVLVDLILGNGVGSNPLVRAVASLPIIGLGFNIVVEFVELTGVGSPDNVLQTIGILGFVAGLVLVSILTIAAKTWRGWRRFVPLLVTLMLFAGQLIANRYVGQAVVIAPWVLLGYVVATASPEPEPAQSATA